MNRPTDPNIARRYYARLLLGLSVAAAEFVLFTTLLGLLIWAMFDSDLITSFILGFALAAALAGCAIPFYYRPARWVCDRLLGEFGPPADSEGENTASSPKTGPEKENGARP